MEIIQMVMQMMIPVLYINMFDDEIADESIIN